MGGASEYEGTGGVTAATAVAEDAEAAAEEAALDPVPFHVLLRQEPHQGLCHGQAGRHPFLLPMRGIVAPGTFIHRCSAVNSGAT